MSEKIHEKRELSKNTNKTVIFKKQNKKIKKLCRLWLNCDLRDPWLPSSGSFANILKTLYQLAS